MNRKIEKYYDTDGKLMALLIPHEYSNTGICFLTDNQSYQQIAYMNHEKKYKILPHYHNQIERVVNYTCETLVIKKGILQVTLYEKQKSIHQFNIYTGDVLTLFSGGHSFIMIDDVEMIEIKQGPFLGDKDKTRFMEEI